MRHKGYKIFQVHVLRQESKILDKLETMLEREMKVDENEAKPCSKIY